MRCQALRLLALGSVAVLVATASCWAKDADDEKLDCANAISTPEINLCARQDFENADAVLNDTYKKALAAILSKATEKPNDAKSRENALRARQRAWVAKRDAECSTLNPNFSAGGTAITAEILACKTELTKARTVVLKDQYDSN